MKISRMFKSIIICSFLISIISSCSNNAGNTGIAHADSTDEIYTCSMHPQVVEHAPGNCPICGMTLVKKENANREVSKVDLSTTLAPTNTSVISTIPVTTMQYSKQQVRIDALGSVDYDTRYMKTISAKVGGRIEKLFIKYRYQPISAGDKIMDIYSPELLTAEQNLLYLRRNDPSNNSLITAATERLLLLGMSRRELSQVVATGVARPAVTVYSNYSGHIHETGSMINSSQTSGTISDAGELSIKEGMYVEKSQPLFQVNNMDNVWINLHFSAGDNSSINVGDNVTIFPETLPDQKIFSKISFIEPFYNNDSKTVSARVYFNNSKLMLPVGSQVKAVLETKTSFSNWLPQESVLSLGLRNVVFLKQASSFKVHPVNTGISMNNFIQILDGLGDKDSVAENAQFLIDSEGFIKTKQ
jgi:membrane fusion protein, copper/silver efflux system